MSSISIDKEVKVALEALMQRNGLTAQSPFLYYENEDLHIGFSTKEQAESLHYALSFGQWRPLHHV